MKWIMLILLLILTSCTPARTYYPDAQRVIIQPGYSEEYFGSPYVPNFRRDYYYENSVPRYYH